jgi:GNAT superfamily N-acetyltransferase
MIREGTIQDKTRAIILLKHSREGAGFGSVDGPTGFTFEFDPAYAERVFLTHLLRPDMLCLVLDVDGMAQGLLLAVAYEHPFGPVRMARETVWWIEPDHRGLSAVRMLEAYEDWCRSQDCHYSGMAAMGGDESVGRLYMRRGYRAAETHYLKAV